MNFTPGLIVVAMAVVLFYVKRGLQQYLKARREARLTNLEIRKAQKESRKVQPPQKPEEKVGIRVRNWWWIFGSFLLVLAGLIVQSSELGLPAGVVEAWWIPVTLGIVWFTFTID
jgi:heme/copper-type cytochrome/quinol oxidase subunit 2